MADNSSTAQSQNQNTPTVTETSVDDQEFCVIFRKEALHKLKKMAMELGVTTDKLGDVVMKGLHILNLAEKGKILIEREKDCLEIDINKL